MVTNFLSLEVSIQGADVCLSHPKLAGESQISIYNSPTLAKACLVVKGKAKQGVIQLKTALTGRLYVVVRQDKLVFIGATRRVMIDGLYNCRDLGGYATANGELVRWGALYRSDALDHLTLSDQMYLQNMKLGTVIDFRTTGEREKRPNQLWSSVKEWQFDPKGTTAKEAGEMQLGLNDQEKIESLEKLAQTTKGQNELLQKQHSMVQQMRRLVESTEAQHAYSQFLHQLLIARNDGPVLFHCQGGKDRTGWAAALVLGLLGVDKPTIYADYLLTNEFNQERNHQRMSVYRSYTDNPLVLDYLRSLQLTTTDYLDGAFDVLAERKQSIETYAQVNLAFSKTDSEDLKNWLLYGRDNP